MDIHVLGCHGPFPGANGATSGYLLVSGGHQLLIDCGAGVLGKLAAKMDPTALDGVLLSHLHYDHMSDALVLQYQLQAAGKRLPLFVPPEDASPQRALLSAAFDVASYPRQMGLGALTITSFPVRHPVPCRALRITEGEKTFVYTGDTNDCPGLSDFCRGADVLLADAAFLTDEWRDTLPHMSAAGAARLAQNAGVKRLYLTHLPLRHAPQTLEAQAREIFPGAQAVAPGMVISL